MATVEYPSGLPYPLREGYGLKHVSPLMRTEMQSGRARQRRRFTSVPSEAQVSWLMTQEQAQIFEGFFRWGVTDGADWFNCPLQTPMGIQLYEARFTDIYSGPELVGVNYWRFTAQIEIRERQTLSKLWYGFSDFILSQSIIDKAINREWPKQTWDYATYAAALADLDNLVMGQYVTVESDETQDGASTQYRVYIAPAVTLSLDFSEQRYYAFDKDSALIPVTS